MPDPNSFYADCIVLAFHIVSIHKLMTS